MPKIYTTRQCKEPMRHGRIAGISQESLSFAHSCNSRFLKRYIVALASNVSIAGLDVKSRLLRLCLCYARA